MHILPKVLSWGKCKWSILAAKFGTNSIGKNTKQIIMWCEASLWCFEMAPKSICLSQFLFLVWFIQISGVSFRRDKSTFFYGTILCRGNFSVEMLKHLSDHLCSSALVPGNAKTHIEMHTGKLWGWMSLFNLFGGKEIICNLRVPKNCQD